MRIEEAALILWLNDNPTRPAEDYGLLTHAGQSEYEARAGTLMKRAGPGNGTSALGFPLIRIEVSKSAATHFVEDMRENGFEPKRDGVHVSFARDGVPDERYTAIVADAGSQIHVRPDPRPLTLG